jgi:prepilin-type processing-associated H-X9-DG protein
MNDFDHFVGTQPVADKHSFDVAALSLWLQTHLSGFQGPLTVASFKGGQSNPTYKLQTPSRSYVMRAKPGPVAKLLPSAHAIEREFAVMRGLAGTQVPVPTMYCLCEDESVIGRAFYIMEFIYNWYNIRFRHRKNNATNVLFADGHVTDYLIKGIRQSDLKRYNFYVNP